MQVPVNILVASHCSARADMHTDSDEEDANCDRLADASMKIHDEWGAGVVDDKLAKALSKRKPGNSTFSAPAAKKKQKTTKASQRSEKGSPATPAGSASGEPSAAKVSTLCAKGSSCNVSFSCTCFGFVHISPCRFTRSVIFGQTVKSSGGTKIAKCLENRFQL